MNRRRVGLSLLFCLTVAQAAADVSATYPPELQHRLAAALDAKGSEYRPRTEHLLPDGRPRYTNRLILEDSPYLIQHAHNPVGLYRHREGRPHPHRDEKILTAWSGMMIAALAEAADILGEPRYLSAAERAQELLWTEQRPAPGRINRVYLDGRTAQPGLSEDDAFLGQAMIALYDATGEQGWLTRAREMADARWEGFADQGKGGLFMGEAAEDTPPMTRPKDLTDAVIPSATSAALQLLAELTRRTDELEYERHASSLLASTSGRVAQVPSAFPALNLMRHGDAGPVQYRRAPNRGLARDAVKAS